MCYQTGHRCEKRSFVPQGAAGKWYQRTLLVSVKRSSHYVPGAVLSAPRALNSRQFDERAILTLHTREGHKGKQFRPRVPS